jgi:hypothetical protein
MTDPATRIAEAALIEEIADLAPAAGAIAAELGPGATADAAAPGLGSSDPRHRAVALMLLGFAARVQGEAAGRAVALLLTACRAETAVRPLVVALRWTAEHAPDDAVAAALGHVRHPDPGIRRRVAEVLFDSAPRCPEAREALAGLLGDELPVAAAAAWGLAAAGDPRATTAVRACVEGAGASDDIEHLPRLMEAAALCADPSLHAPLVALRERIQRHSTTEPAGLEAALGWCAPAGERDPATPGLDPRRARWLTGKRVIVTLDGAERRQVQAVVTAAGGDGLVLHALPDWRRLDLPPDTDAFAPAARGDYVLAGSGETVSDPDAIARWALSAEAVAA